MRIEFCHLRDAVYACVLETRTIIIKGVIGDMKYSEMYSDAEGETHFREVEVAFSVVDVAPPAAPMNISDFRSAREVAFISLPAGWGGGWHPAPSVGHIFVLQGEMEVEVSDGEKRRFPQGSVWLHRDLIGKGHDTRVVSKEGAMLAMVKMNESK